MSHVKSPAAAKPAQSTKPGAPTGKPKKEKVERKAYPGIMAGADNKGTVKLKDWPADYDPKLHLPLRRNDFENEAVLLEKMADQMAERVVKLRAEAEICRKSGSATQRAKLKRIARLKEMLAKLEAEGDDEAPAAGEAAPSTEGTAAPAA